MKLLLNIDGGGVRGYFPLLILNYIEKKINKKISDIFDYYSGVSASSIILAGLLTKYSIDDTIQLFKNVSKNIFYRSYFHIIKSGSGLFDSKYTDYYINLELQKYFNDIKLTDIKKPFTILTYDIQNSSPKCWHSHNEKHDHYLWEIIRSSTAAPVYFPPYKLNEHVLIDGGVVANNLSEFIFTHALVHFGPDEEFYQISIGTGNFNPTPTTIPTGLWSWSGNLINVFFNASSTYEMNTLKKLSKIEKLKHFHRLDINLNQDILLDDYTAFDKMDIIFQQWLTTNQTLLDQICFELSQK